MTDYKVVKTDAGWRAQLEPIGERFCVNSAAIDFAPK